MPQARHGYLSLISADIDHVPSTVSPCTMNFHLFELVGIFLFRSCSYSDMPSIMGCFVNDRVWKMCCSEEDTQSKVYHWVVVVAAGWPVVSAPQPSLPVCWSPPVVVAAQSDASASQLAPGAAA